MVAPSTAWTVVQPYSTDNTWQRDTTGVAPGTSTVQVRVRTAGTGVLYDVMNNMLYVVK